MNESLVETEEHYRRLLDIVGQMKSVLIAFSGGVDSTLLLKVAVEVLGEQALAVTARSETMPRHELEAAVNLAQDIGANHLIVESHEMDLPEFLANPADKCYICKKSRFRALMEIARDRRLVYVVDGSNMDDLADYRPGRKALLELGVRSPLCEAELTKAEVRRLSKQLGLPTWNKPAYACLASRIPYGSRITVDKLKQVDAAEEFLRSLGLTEQVRVRHYGDTARIEVTLQSISGLAAEPVRSEIVSFFKKLGFTYVSLDLEGYTMGSLNRTIKQES
jgi:uncharacterized protein